MNCRNTYLGCVEILNLRKIKEFVKLLGAGYTHHLSARARLASTPLRNAMAMMPWDANATTATPVTGISRLTPARRFLGTAGLRT